MKECVDHVHPEAWIVETAESRAAEILMFVEGLAVVRAHNHWALDWTVLVTLSGWFFLALGLVRMFSAAQYQRSAAGTPPVVFMVLEGILLVLALFVTYKAYSPEA